MARSIGAAARAVLALVSLTVTAAAGAQALPVLAPCSREFDPKVFLAGGQAIAIDLPSLRAIPTQGDALIAGFPLSPEMSADLLVHRIVPVTSKAQFVVVGKGGRESEVVPGEMHFFGGSIVGVPGSSAFLSVTDAGVFGWVQSEEARFIVSSGPMTAPHTPAVFDMASEAFSQIAWTPFMCGANQLLNAGGLGQQDAPPPSSTLLPTCRSIDIAIDTDQEFLATFGGNATAALGYVQTLVAGADEIYRRDLSLQLRISYSRFWSTTDPWTQPDSYNQILEFSNYWITNMGSVSRDVAHLFSTRSLGGGIAAISAICNPSYGFGVCGDLTGSFPTPLVDHSSQNWDIIVFPHELGHNCGATHTHDTCPPADRCPPAAYFGPCQTEQVCSSSGTIMSYCHLCNGGDANIVLNFHSASQAQIASYMSSASCATSVNCSSNPACVLTISSASATIPATGGGQSITVTTVGPGCGWTPVSVPSWITVTNPGPASGNGTFAYTVQANTTYSDRSATLQIGDLTHTVTQLSAVDCNANGISDTTEIAGNPALDCNGDGVLNSCEISEGAADCDGNGVPDACQVTTTVRAWGAGAAGTSGGVNYGQSTVPSTLGPAKYIGAGANHSLAVQFDGKVIGWGYNGYGQVNIPATLPNALAVTGGGNHSVALVLGGAVVCWGLNSDGQCNVPGDVGTTIAIAAGNAHTVALRSNHTVACWGANASGQSTVPAGLVNVTAISAGSLNTLALGSTGTITGWGHNVYGQSTPPAGLTNVTAIASGAVHSIALRNDGTMTCWGNNTFAQCTVPSDIGVVQKVFAGGYVTIALRTDGTVRMWGRNDYGQATPPAGIANDRMLAAGTSHTLTLESVSTLADCDHDGIPDGCEIQAGAADCDHNGVPDSCDIAAGAADANGNGVLDVCEIASGSAAQWGASNGGNGHWYSRIDNSLSWDAAEAAAEAKGGTLVTITSQAEGVFIHNFVAPAMNFWAGGRRISGLWQWVTGEAWSYEAWNCQQCHPSCQPDNQGEDWLEAMCWDGTSIRWNNYTSSNGRPSYVIEWSADCNNDGLVDYGQIRSGQLADCDHDGIPDGCEIQAGAADCDHNGVPDSCDIAAGAADANGNGVLDVCEVTNGPATQWRVQDGGNGHWYERTATTANWFDAKAQAEARGGHLATLSNAAENAFISAHGAASYDWLGGYAPPHLGCYPSWWQWVTGEPWSYAPWSPGEPNYCDEVALTAAWNNYWPEQPSHYWIEWDADCNNDGLVDYGQIRLGQLADTNSNGVPDICESGNCAGANPTVPNDCMRNATIVLGDATIAFSNVGCNTDGPTHPEGTCESGNYLFLNDIWYRVQATANGTMRISTCNQVNFDSKLAVYGLGTNSDNFDYSTLANALLGCNDDGSPACQANAIYASDLSVTVASGNWYLIRVAAYWTPGSGSVTIDVPDQDCNGDGIADAQQIRTGKLADFDSNLIPDCCEHGETCVLGNYPVQWRVADGGNGHWYRGVVEANSWIAAREKARAVGGDLASVETILEHTFIAEAILTPQPQLFAAGGGWGPHIGGVQSPGSQEPLGGWNWLTGVGVDCSAGLCAMENCCGNQDRLAYAISGSGFAFNDVAAASTVDTPSYLIEWSADCNNDGIVDYGQILNGQLADANANGVPDSCELGPNDCNHDGILDADQIRAGQLADFDSDLIPDCCERGETCVLGNYPVQWRIEDGGDGTWYKVDTTARTAVSSKDAAVSAGGHLAIIRSLNENTVVQRLVSAQAATNSAWIGGYQDFASPNYSEPAGGWKWLDGTAIAGYTNWDTATGAPNNAGGFQEDWVEMLPTGTWNDARRTLPRPMVIEWEADCNNDGIVDYGQILNGQLADTNHNGVPDLCEGPPADLNHDGRVDANDLALLLGNWGLTNAVGDINHDGITDATDLAMLLGSWG